MMKVLLLVPDSKNRYREFVNLANNNWNNEVDFEFVVSDFFAKSDLKSEYIHHRISINGIVNYSYQSSSLYKFLDFFFKKISIWQLIKSFIKLIYLKKIYIESRNKCSETRPDFIFVSGDRQQGIVHSFLKAANELKIKIIHPYLVSENITWSKRINNNSYQYNRHSSFFEKYIFKKFMNHSFQIYEKKIFFYQANDLLAYYLFGSLGDYSWWSGNTFSDVICVDSTLTKNYYIEYGKIKKNKIHIIGDFKYNPLIKRLGSKELIKERISKKYKLLSNEKIIIVGLPQFYEEGDFQITWEDHKSEIDFLLTSVTNNYSNVLVSLHPKMDKNIYSNILQKYNCNIVEEGLDQIICISDLYIATNSSTINWAILLGIKTITICFYGLDDTYHRNFNTTKIAYNHKDFVKFITNVFKEEVNFNKDWEILSKNSMFNMQITSRYTNLLKQNL